MNEKCVAFNKSHNLYWEIQHEYSHLYTGKLESSSYQDVEDAALVAVKSFWRLHGCWIPRPAGTHSPLTLSVHLTTALDQPVWSGIVQVEMIPCFSISKSKPQESNH